MTRERRPRRGPRLGEVVRAARENLGVSRAELAAHAKVTLGYLGAVETNLRIPSAKVLERIAARLDLRLDELLALAGRLPPAVQRLIETDSTALAVLQAMIALRRAERRQVLALAEELARGRDGRR